MAIRNAAYPSVFQQTGITSPAPAPAPVANATLARWDGYTVMSDATLHWHNGELPARWLARRGILLDVIRMDLPLDVERIPMSPPGARGLFDSSTGGERSEVVGLQALGASH